MRVARPTARRRRRNAQVILRHCLERAREGGHAGDGIEAAELGDYLRDLRPTLAQFDPAIRRLDDAVKDEVLALVAAAMPGGCRRRSGVPRKSEFLADLSASCMRSMQLRPLQPTRDA